MHYLGFPLPDPPFIPPSPILHLSKGIGPILRGGEGHVVGTDSVVLPSLTRSAPCSPCHHSLYRHHACSPCHRSLCQCHVPLLLFTTSVQCSPCCCSLCGSRGALVIMRFNWCEHTSSLLWICWQWAVRFEVVSEDQGEKDGK